MAMKVPGKPSRPGKSPGKSPGNRPGNPPGNPPAERVERVGRAAGSARRGRERRGSERADARLSMRVEAGATGAARIVTETQNVSASGVYCHASHYLAPLSRVQITLVIPRLPATAKGAGPELMKCDGIVVRCDQRQVAPGAGKPDKPYELACMFTRLDAGLRDRLEEFVTWRNLQALRAVLGQPEGDADRAVRRTQSRRAAPAVSAGRGPAKPTVRAANSASRPKPRPVTRPAAKARPAGAGTAAASPASRNGSGRTRH